MMNVRKSKRVTFFDSTRFPVTRLSASKFANVTARRFVILMSKKCNAIMIGMANNPSKSSGFWKLMPTIIASPGCAVQKMPLSVS